MKIPIETWLFGGWDDPHDVYNRRHIDGFHCLNGHDAKATRENFKDFETFSRAINNIVCGCDDDNAYALPTTETLREWFVHYAKATGGES